MKRFFQRAYHLSQRIVRESRQTLPRIKTYGVKVALTAFWDGLIPPGKTEHYISVIQNYVNGFAQETIDSYCKQEPQPVIVQDQRHKKIPVWCCWWQGEEQMPELVRLCRARLKQVLPPEAEPHLITLTNYREYVEIPEHIVRKFEAGIITMTTMSDVLRFALLTRYGGYWLDATVFFSGDIPKEYFSGKFFCQRMTDSPQSKREACKGNWCGFSMAGEAGNIVFRYMLDVFSEWWKQYDSIIDYVLIDYLLMAGFQGVPAIHQVIDEVPNNNEEIFLLYQHLNDPYSPELYRQLTAHNVMHKLTYKMDLMKKTADGRQTLYGYLCEKILYSEESAG